MRTRVGAIAVLPLLLVGCSGDPTPSEHTEWLAATTGERDAVEVQRRLDEVHTNLSLGTGPEVDRYSVEMIAALDTTTVVPLLACMAKISEVETDGDFEDIATRCDEDPLAAYE